MKYKTIKDLGDKEFSRLTGVKRPTFNKMIGILNEAEKKKKSKGGKPNSLSMEDRLLMALEYIREYGTYFHIASSYGISESACYRNIIWIEDTLINHPDFSLPGSKALLDPSNRYELLTIDATERPKKSKKGTQRIKSKVSS